MSDPGNVRADLRTYSVDEWAVKNQFVIIFGTTSKYWLEINLHPTNLLLFTMYNLMLLNNWVDNYQGVWVIFTRVDKYKAGHRCIGWWIKVFARKKSLIVITCPLYLVIWYVPCVFSSSLYPPAHFCDLLLYTNVLVYLKLKTYYPCNFECCPSFTLNHWNFPLDLLSLHQAWCRWLF